MLLQTQKGKAFEYACLKALNEHLKKNQEVKLEDTDAFMKELRRLDTIYPEKYQEN